MIAIANVSIPSSASVDFDIAWSSEKETIKRAFRREVLPLIEKGLRDCGIEDGFACPNCYSYESICSFHEEVREVSFEELKSQRTCWTLTVMRELDYFDHKRIDGDAFVALYQNWKERIERLSWGQEYTF